MKATGEPPACLKEEINDFVHVLAMQFYCFCGFHNAFLQKMRMQIRVPRRSEVAALTEL